MTSTKAPARIWARPPDNICVISFTTPSLEYKVEYIRADLVADAVEALEEAQEYFDNRADADCDQDGYIPNREMTLLTQVRDALARIGGAS